MLFSLHYIKYLVEDRKITSVTSRSIMYTGAEVALKQCILSSNQGTNGISVKSPASRLFTQPFVQTQVIENIKAQRHWPLWGECTDDRWIPRTKGQ